jgi:hypothetical protein
MATVHSYKRWDIRRDRYVTTRLKGTPHYIASIEGEIMLNTEEEVSPRDTDKQGRYDPKAKDSRTQFEHRLFHRVSGMEDGGFGTLGATAEEELDRTPPE